MKSSKTIVRCSDYKRLTKLRCKEIRVNIQQLMMSKGGNGQVMSKNNIISAALQVVIKT